MVASYSLCRHGWAQRSRRSRRSRRSDGFKLRLARALQRTASSASARLRAILLAMRSRVAVAVLTAALATAAIVAVAPSRPAAADDACAAAAATVLCNTPLARAPRRRNPPPPMLPLYPPSPPPSTSSNLPMPPISPPPPPRSCSLAAFWQSIWLDSGSISPLDGTLGDGGWSGGSRRHSIGPAAAEFSTLERPSSRGVGRSLSRRHSRSLPTSSRFARRGARSRGAPVPSRPGAQMWLGTPRQHQERGTVPVVLTFSTRARPTDRAAPRRDATRCDARARGGGPARGAHF